MSPSSGGGHKDARPWEGIILCPQQLLQGVPQTPGELKHVVGLGFYSSLASLSVQGVMDGTCVGHRDPPGFGKKRDISRMLSPGMQVPCAPVCFQSHVSLLRHSLATRGSPCLSSSPSVLPPAGPCRIPGSPCVSPEGLTAPEPRAEGTWRIQLQGMTRNHETRSRNREQD